MNAAPLRIGISTCPNDTFAFHGLLSGAVDARGLALEFELCDVEELNRRLLAGEFDAAKASFATALELTAETLVLPVGAAVGRGVGPVVLRAASRPPSAAEARVLTPGEHTTAALLWRLLHPGEGRLRHVLFSEIMPALQRGEADLGLCIHEGRFTYTQWQLELAEDLGASWEALSGLPLPLGGILARRSLGRERVTTLAEALGASLEFAHGHPESALASMRAHAQEHSDAVLWKHVELYVTDETRCLSEEARRALTELVRRAQALGIGSGRPLEIA